MRQDPSRLAETERVADRLASKLARLGARHVFGMPGSHTTTVYDALGLLPNLDTVLIRNEQAAAFAADGYARVTGRPGIVCTTAGPGATNALTGVAEAWADSIPVLLLAGQVNADRLDQECGAYHEVDLEAILRPVTRFASTIRRASDLEPALARAWIALESGRRRPAALILPQDVMKHPASSGVEVDPPPPSRLAPDPAAIRRAAEALRAATRPVILAGGGALWSDAGDLVRAVAERLGAPVVTTLNGKGLLDERDPLSFGHARSARAKALLPHADAMLAIGCRFTEVMTHWRTMPVPENLVQIDIDPDQVGMNHPVRVGIVADARSALESLLTHLDARGDDPWRAIREAASRARPRQPEWLIDVLRAELPETGVVFTDACEIGYRMHADWVATGPRRFFYPSNYITLGWGFPAAIGASVALGNEVPVVSISGDGGFVMTCQELATAARERLRLVAIVHNDSTYGAIKNIQERNHGGRFVDVDLNNPEFLALAGAFGVPAARASSPESFAAAVREALARNGPSLIEVPDTWRKIRDGAS